MTMDPEERCMKNQNRRLPEAELDVMLVLWEQNGPVRPSKLLELLNLDGHDWSMSTVQTMLARLEEKGFAAFERRKRFRYYYPTVTREEYSLGETQSFLDKLYDSSPAKLIASLVEADDLDDGELDELQAILDRGKRRK